MTKALWNKVHTPINLSMYIYPYIPVSLVVKVITEVLVIPTELLADTM